MRLLALLVLALAVAIPASAQNATDNTSANESAAGNQTGAETASPAVPEPITIELEGLAEDGFFFRKVGDTTRNPTLTVQPGQKVTFVFTTVSGVHNLNINGEVMTKILGEGERETIEWTAPMTPGVIQYWCDPHKASGMVGRIQVGAAAPPAASGDEETIEGPTVDLGQYDASCAGKTAPASAANGEVGMPTIQDYVQKLCLSSDGTEQVAADPYKSADYVIPLSWALIGLGIVGVVWVHKYYKP